MIGYLAAKKHACRKFHRVVYKRLEGEIHDKAAVLNSYHSYQ